MSIKSNIKVLNFHITDKHDFICTYMFKKQIKLKLIKKITKIQ